MPINLALIEEHERSHSGHTDTTELAVNNNIKVPVKLLDQSVF